MDINIIITVFVMISTFGAAMGIRASRIRRQMSMVSAALGDGTDGAPSLRELEMARSWRERVLGPMLVRATRFGRALTPAKNLEALQKDLIMAGLHERFSVPDFLGLRFLIGIGLGTLLFFTVGANRPFFSSLMFSLCGFVVGLYAPNLWLRGKVSKRQRVITRELPDAIDMMSICVDAGMSFEAALQKIGLHSDTELSIEIRRVLTEIRVGVPRGDALRHLVQRTGVDDVSSFVAVLIQADTMGISIRDVLHTQSVQMRVKRRQRAEELARQAPLKMLIPLVFCIFPALFAIILGPAVPKLMNVF